MTADQFRRLALSFPGAAEGAHQGHADFRAGGKIFATLGYPSEKWGMLKLTPSQQAEYLRAEPTLFSPSKGAWGRQGCTLVFLRPATKVTVLPAMSAAWQNVAPE